MHYTAVTTTAPATNGYLYAAWGGEQVVDSNTYVGLGAMAFTSGLRFNSTLRSYYINNVLSNGEDFDETTQNLIEA